MRRNWREVIDHRMETANLGPVNRATILDHLLSKVLEKMKERYTSVLEENNIGQLLERALNPIVKAICEQGNFDLKR